jgi:pilus assembly protein Flp/PilA
MVRVRRCDPRSIGEAARPAGEEGQGLVEYALILLFVAVAIVGALGAFGGGLAGEYSSIASTVASL